MLDGLVRRPVLTKTDRVVRKNVDDPKLHQRRHAQRVARVVGERQKCAGERHEAAVRRNAVRDRAHAEFAHAVVDVAAFQRVGSKRARLAPLGQIAAGEIGRAADDLRQRRRQRFERQL